MTGKEERERKRASAIEAYVTMYRSALVAVAEKRITGEISVLIKAHCGGFHEHVLRVTEEVRVMEEGREI